MIKPPQKRKAARASNTLAALTLLGAGSSAFFTPSAVRAADPYDQSLEKRVETLERELNIMEGDKKGKNVVETDAPTFLKAGGKNVKELVISGEMRFRYKYGQADG